MEQQLNMLGAEDMEPRIWRRLPHSLVDRVIAFLPPPAFFRFRSVCKRWYALLSSARFRQTYLSVSPRHHWFLFFKRKTQNGYIYNTNNGNSHGDEICEGYLYDPSEKRWYRLTFPSCMSGFTPAASSGGLITWVSDQAGFKQLVVSNPYLKSFALPPQTPLQRLCPSVGLISTDSVFWVMLAGDDLVSPYNVKNISAESLNVFRGDSGAILFSLWEPSTRSEVPNLADLGRMVFVGGKFYGMSYSPFKVLAYDIPTSAWTEIKPPMTRYLRSPCLLECGGRLFLIAAVTKKTISEPYTVRLWGYYPGHRQTWQKAMKMPQQVYEQFSSVENGDGFDCVGHGDFIVFTFTASGMILLFDLRQNTWEWIPICPYIYAYGGTTATLQGFAYEPRLLTPAMELLEPFSQIVRVSHPIANN